MLQAGKQAKEGQIIALKDPAKTRCWQKRRNQGRAAQVAGHEVWFVSSIIRGQNSKFGYTLLANLGLGTDQLFFRGNLHVQRE